MNTVLTDDLLGELRALGAFFDLRTHPAGSAVRPPWHAMSELGEHPAVLTDRVLAVRTHLAAGRPLDAVEARVAASVTHLGLVARLLSPTLAVAVSRGALLDMDPVRCWWQPTIGGAFPLSVPDDGVQPVDALSLLVDMLTARVLDGPVRTLGAAMTSVSARVLWGNVASAVNGATSMIVVARPDLADRAGALAARLLDLPPLRGTSTTDEGRFRRRSCCLIYRAAPGAAGPVCGDCVLTAVR